MKTTPTVQQVLSLGHQKYVAGLNIFVSTQPLSNLGQWCDKTTLKPNYKNQLDLTFEINTLYTNNNK